MMCRRFSASAGFTYIAALFMVVVLGIMLGAVGQSVRVIMKREREKELIFRGLQYRDAIERWNDPKKNRGPLKELKYLYELPQSSSISKSDDRLIRKLYKDPITGGDWKTLPSTPDPVQGIYGVASSSNEEPFKQGNFPEGIKNFEGKQKYSEWEFIFKKQPLAVKGAPVPNQTNQPSSLSMPLSTPEGN